MTGTFEYGETVLLYEAVKRRTFLITLQEGGVLHTPWGTLPHLLVVGQEEGAGLESSRGRPFYAFRPRVGDYMMKVRRRTQIVYPKDAGWLVLALDLFPGARVLEMGTGSGAFTTLLARLVGKEGRVYTFDRREDFQENALSNLSRAGLADRVEARILSAGEPFPVADVDGVFLDLPDPWLAAAQAYESLKPGRPLALIVPTAEQLKEAVKSLESCRFVFIEALELLERRILVRQQEGVRPADRMIGFTGYLVSARKSAKRGEVQEES